MHFTETTLYALTVLESFYNALSQLEASEVVDLAHVWITCTLWWQIKTTKQAHFCWVKPETDKEEKVHTFLWLFHIAVAKRSSKILSPQQYLPCLTNRKVWIFFVSCKLWACGKGQKYAACFSAKTAECDPTYGSFYC